MARVTILSLYARGGVVYGTATTIPDKGPIEVDAPAPIDYIISNARWQGDTITNAEEVLYWLHRNVVFKPI